jgi:DNA-binding transcriptional LysR family regulator
VNLKQLQVFVAVAESGSFSRAAESTHITQSTVSQHISSLESEFSLKLLDRTGKGALLTEAGKLLFLHARRVISGAEEIPVILNRFKGLEDAVLKLGGSNIPACYIIPDFIPLFNRLKPGVTIVLYQGDSRQVLEMLIREECELSVTGCRFNEEEFVYTPLTEDRVSLVVNSDHRWYSREWVSLEEIVDEPLIFREPGSGTGKTVRAGFAAAGFSPEHLRIKTCLGSNESVKQAILAGAGISFLSEMSVKKECERGDLRILKVYGMDMLRSIYLVKRRGRELSPAADSFVSLITDNYSNGLKIK